MLYIVHGIKGLSVIYAIDSLSGDFVSCYGLSFMFLIYHVIDEPMITHKCGADSLN